MSFTDVIDDLKTKLETNAALMAFCMEQWGNSLTVRKVYKKRIAVSLDELPLIMITAPRVDPREWTIGEIEREHRVRLYCGFHQEDLSLAQDQLVEFEELIEDVVLEYKQSGGGDLPAGILDIDPGPAENDEGSYHPVYFLVKDVQILAIRSLS
jgi:hypothetical protein